MTIYESEDYEKVLKILENQLSYYKTLEKYTGKSVKVKKHRSNIEFMQEAIQEVTDEYEETKNHTK